ncbi:MAG TPA: DUF3800 domain-containing protein [Candidatus Limnocylindrales bacterium]|nr:DUF3800 domain-containing protein [Candidatus Limnocylindrales bacterium]
MLFFFDESFRESLAHPGVSLGALCGVGVPEAQLRRMADDIYELKRRYFGIEFAKNSEIKGKELFKNYVFALQKKGIVSKNLALGQELVEYIHARRLPVFGCVCFEKRMQNFQAEDVTSLDKTFRYLFERIDTWMKINRPDEKALIIFDDRDYGINKKNAEAITNFFQRSSQGAAMDSIVQTPLFAISQAQNVGLQLADLVTTIIGLRFSSHEDIKPVFASLKRSIPFYDQNGGNVSALKVFRDNS